jgi:hypothetical protein
VVHRAYRLGDGPTGQVPPTVSYRDVEELLVERGVDVGHVTIYR